jgi:hypothetical protein
MVKKILSAVVAVAFLAVASKKASDDTAAAVKGAGK